MSSHGRGLHDRAQWLPVKIFSSSLSTARRPTSSLFWCGDLLQLHLLRITSLVGLGTLWFLARPCHLEPVQQRVSSQETCAAKVVASAELMGVAIRSGWWSLTSPQSSGRNGLHLPMSHLRAARFWSSATVFSVFKRLPKQGSKQPYCG